MAGEPAAASSESGGARAAVKLGAALVLAARLFDAAPLYVPGVAAVLLGAGCLAWVASGARGVAVRRRLAAARVVEGEPLGVGIELRSAGAALPSCLVVDPLLDRPVALRGGRRRETVELQARFERRGRRALAPSAALVRDPLGLAQRAVAGPGGDEVLVLPRVEPVRAAAGAGGRAGVGGRGRPRTAAAAAVDVDGLRPHREGAPASRIHWPSFARRGELLERRMRAEGDARPLVALDARGEDEAALDAAVRAAASLCVHLAEAGGCALLLPGERRPALLEAGLSGWPHLHARLAVVAAGAAAHPGVLAAHRGAVFLVVARLPARAAAALAAAPAAGRFVVVPGALGGRRPTFTVAGCTGYDIALRPGRAA